MKHESDETLVGHLKPRSPLGEWGNSLVFAPLILALVLSLFMPMIFRAREMRARTVCAQSLKEIVLAHVLAQQNGTPISLGTPTSLKTCPKASAPNYIILPPHAGNIGPDEPVAYEPLENHGEGGNVAYVDGHVEWLAREEYNRVLAPFFHPQTQPSTGTSRE